MKRLLAVLLVCLLVLCGCKAVPQEENAAAADRVADKEPVLENSSSGEENEAPTPGQSGAEEDSSKESDSSKVTEKHSETVFSRVEYGGTGKLDCLTSGVLDAYFDYEIFYYGIENFYIKVDGKETELRKALKKDPKVMDALYAEWKEDHGTQYLYKDGGSVKYPYEFYIANKLHQLQPKGDAVYEDLILCGPGVSLDFLCELIKEEGYRVRKPAESTVKRVEYSEKNAMERLTEGELGKLFDYDIFYLGIKNFYIEMDGQEIELRKALEKDPKIIEELYAEWREDHGSKYAYYDGGSVYYPYEAYVAFRVAFSTLNPERHQPNDLVICRRGGA